MLRNTAIMVVAAQSLVKTGGEFMAFETLFKKLREKGMTQAQLANAVGARVETVSAWKHGTHGMTLVSAIAIRDSVFPELSLDELFCDVK